MDNNFIKKAELCNRVISKARPFEGDMLKQVREFFRISTTWSSNALEGNTLTISETKVLLEDGMLVEKLLEKLWKLMDIAMPMIICFL